VADTPAKIIRLPHPFTAAKDAIGLGLPYRFEDGDRTVEVTYVEFKKFLRRLRKKYVLHFTDSGARYRARCLTTDGENVELELHSADAVDLVKFHVDSLDPD
jgi:hypothetical protein